MLIAGLKSPSRMKGDDYGDTFRDGADFEDEHADAPLSIVLAQSGFNGTFLCSLADIGQQGPLSSRDVPN